MEKKGVVVVVEIGRSGRAQHAGQAGETLPATHRVELGAVLLDRLAKRVVKRGSLR